MRKLGILHISLFLFHGLYAVRPGDTVKDWQLSDINNQLHKLSDHKGKVIVMEWFNYDCPFVQKHYQTGSIQKLQKNWVQKGVVWFSIRSGAFESRKLKKAVEAFNPGSSAVLEDPKGSVAKKVGARTTPHVFIIDPSGKLAYNGALDDQPTPDPESLKHARNFVSEALESIMAGKPVKVSATRPYGCGVK